ncbi:hypothetical protein GGS24DRAFT_513091 [Hypoxylon argillaceum]|nr:hypothetical protein GGS24DRAFT_513091 [Hypoxylon argillaceum]
MAPAQTRDARRKVFLTAVQRAVRREKLREICSLKPTDAECTQVNIAGMLRKWKKYCEAVKSELWLNVIQKADRVTAMDFFDYLCEKYKITSWGTSWEYFRQYKQLYNRMTGRPMDTNDSKEVQKYHDSLIRRYKLRAPNMIDKQVGNWNDLLVLQTFNIAYDTSIVPTERHRASLSGCYLFFACTGCRLAEIVDNEKKKPKDGSWEELYGPKAIYSRDQNKPISHDPVRFDRTYVSTQVGTCEDVQDKFSDKDAELLEEMLSAETTSRGRPKALCYKDILLMVVCYPVTGEDVHTMTVKFIYYKGADNKLKLRLIFCLITVIISLALDDGAFDAPSLTSARAVFEVKNTGPVTCTPLCWKKEWLKRPIFRRFNGPVISKEKALQYYILRDNMAQQSLDAGEEKPMQPKDWRRGAANEANGKASDAVRDQMMRHDPKWATFNNAYINAKVKFHFQNAVIHGTHENALIEMLTHISVTRDLRAGRDIVPDEVWRDMLPDPEIQEIKNLSKEISSKKVQRRKTILKEYRADYFYNCLTWDIEKQIRREDEKDYIEPAIDLQIPERAQLAEIFCYQPEKIGNRELFSLRIQAAELWQRARPQVSMEKEKSFAPKSFPLFMQKTQCSRCIGDKMLLYETRIFPFCRLSVMNDHFDYVKRTGRNWRTWIILGLM